MVVDYADWNGRLVMAHDDATRQGNPILKCPQSNLWFGRWEDLRGFGRPAGWGGPWVADAVKANEPSEPFLLAGFERRMVHLAHGAAEPVTFTLETEHRRRQMETGPPAGVDHRARPRLCVPRDSARHSRRVDPRENRPRRGHRPRPISTFRRAIRRPIRPSSAACRPRSRPAGNPRAFCSRPPAPTCRWRWRRPSSMRRARPRKPATT